MKDSLFGFRDEREREEFIIAIPVLLFFAWLGYYLLGDSAPDLVDAAVVTAQADTDGDGVPDNQDHCTVTAGPASSFGCPSNARSANTLSTNASSATALSSNALSSNAAQTSVPFSERDADGDGIENGQDDCPATPGTMATNGCADKLSIVSENATDLTTVDTDLDLVNDLVDQCPTLAGSAENGGCPIDTDGDTIADAEDRCPNRGGIAENLGCPADADKDGVFDTADNCPNIAGVVANDGCPADSDADGISDDTDQCPQLAAATDNGCPADADGDSIADANDLCPTEPGIAENNGCPAITDSDGDGVADQDDLCPVRSGEARLQGCPPDTDADGVSDADDRCPQIAGLIDNLGCPEEKDTDGDGVDDATDQCPTIQGTAANGCPIDSDGDGVADGDDQCNGEVGTIALRGCAESAAESTIQPATDGIAVADQRILDIAVSQVAFNTSSTTLTSRSKIILRDVASLMKKYPDAILEISGHTDSSGNANRNMDLSMERARACASFIAAEGITLDRLFAYGYGESQPLTSNGTLEGRSTNRRVEFDLKFPE